MEFAIKRAEALIEALPYIKDFFGKTIVIKLSGNMMVEQDLKNNFAQDIVLLRYVGMNPVIVHGGGTQINTWLAKWGIENSFIDGIRITDKESMDVVEMVLAGRINKEIVSLINLHGGRAVGLCGKDAGLIKAKKLKYKKQGKEIDLGNVGDVESINSELIDVLNNAQFIPVISPISYGDSGDTFNINADHVAGRIAASLCAEKLIILTNVPGVMDSDNNLIESINYDEAGKYINKGIIKGGMLPKIECCLEALDGGVKKVHIIDGRIDHSILLEIFTNSGVGTVLNK